MGHRLHPLKGEMCCHPIDKDEPVMVVIPEATPFSVFVPGTGYVVPSDLVGMTKAVDVSTSTATMKPRYEKEQPNTVAKALLKNQARRQKQRSRRTLLRAEKSDTASVSSSVSSASGSVDYESSSIYSSSPCLSSFNTSTPSSGRSTGEHTPTPSTNNQVQDLSQLAPAIFADLFAKATWVCLVRRVRAIRRIRELAGIKSQRHPREACHEDALEESEANHREEVAEVIA